MKKEFVMFHFGWVGFGVTQGSFFNDDVFNIKFIRLGFFGIFKAHFNHLLMFNSFLKRGVEFNDFLIEYDPKVKEFKRRFTKRARDEARRKEEENIAYWKESYEKAYSDFRDVQMKCTQLEQALTTVIEHKMVEKKEAQRAALIRDDERQDAFFKLLQRYSDASIRGNMDERNKAHEALVHWYEENVREQRPPKE